MQFSSIGNRYTGKYGHYRAVCPNAQSVERLLRKGGVFCGVGGTRKTREAKVGGKRRGEKLVFHTAEQLVSKTAFCAHSYLGNSRQINK